MCIKRTIEVIEMKNKYHHITFNLQFDLLMTCYLITKQSNYQKNLFIITITIIKVIQGSAHHKVKEVLFEFYGS